MILRRTLGLLALILLMSGCASQVHKISIDTPKQAASVPLVEAPAIGFKHRIAIAKFDDKTGYGNNLFGSVNDLGTQASDMLASHLIKSKRYIVLERGQLKDLKSENDLQNKESNFVGVSALVFGAVTEYGTKTEWMDAGFSKTKKQVARAKVSIRLVDPQTGVAFFSEFGEASAINESTQTLGFGGKAAYDATIGDRALNGAIVKLVGNMIQTLSQLPWKTSIIDTSNGIIIGAGAQSGLNVGDVLDVRSESRKIKNPVSNATILIPGKIVGQIRVAQLLGGGDIDQAAICDIVKGSDFKVGYEVLEIGEIKP